MKAGVLSLLISLVYMLIAILPLRIKIWKHRGPQNYYDIRKAAKEGDEDAKKILDRGKIMIAILVGGGFLELIAKSIK